MEILQKYFKDLSPKQIQQFSQLGELYREWNAKINVISRKDIDNLYTNHILHALAIAKVIQFKEGTKILDLGTGGGFPGIPLAIFFPQVKFYLVDSIAKKIKVVNAIGEALGLENVRAEQKRAEKVKEQFDFVTVRAVARLESLMIWTKRLIHQNDKNDLTNGILALKGDFPQLKEEIASVRQRKQITKYDLSDLFEEEFFETKCLLHIPC